MHLILWPENPHIAEYHADGVFVKLQDDLQRGHTRVDAWDTTGHSCCLIKPCASSHLAIAASSLALAGLAHIAPIKQDGCDRFAIGNYVFTVLTEQRAFSCTYLGFELPSTKWQADYETPKDKWVPIASNGPAREAAVNDVIRRTTRPTTDLETLAIYLHRREAWTSSAT